MRERLAEAYATALKLVERHRGPLSLQWPQRLRERHALAPKDVAQHPTGGRVPVMNAEPECRRSPGPLVRGPAGDGREHFVRLCPSTIGDGRTRLAEQQRIARP